jgi:hypothetical protein
MSRQGPLKGPHRRAPKHSPYAGSTTCLRWSPATSQQREWLDEIIAGFRTEFGWDVLREKLDAALPNQLHDQP